MLPELMLNRPVALTSFVVVLDLVLRVPFMLWPVCFCNMVLLLVGVRYLLTHLMLLTASTVLHLLWNVRVLWPCCSRFVFNTYCSWATLVVRGWYLYSMEGVTQGTPYLCFCTR